MHMLLNNNLANICLFEHSVTAHFMLFLFQTLLEFLQRVIDHRDKNKMTLKNVAMVMAPNLFVFHGLGSKSTEQSEFVMAAGTANIMLFLIKYQNLLWTVSLCIPICWIESVC